MLVASLALVAAGCGGDDESASGRPARRRGGTEAAEQVITVNWGTEPPSLDPGLATDARRPTSCSTSWIRSSSSTTISTQSPTAAESFETSEDGLTVTYMLRDGLKWTNGDPVTAEDFEYSWKRTVSPELGADYAYQFYGIVGAQEYNGCDPKKDECDALADKMGVKAVDDKTLEVKLTSPQPWFMQQVAHHSFLAVHQKTVEQFGDKWTEPANIVTNGPFKLEEVAAQLQHRHRQVGGMARRRLRQADARQRPHDHRRHDRGAGVRGRRDRRPLPGPAAGRDLRG